MFDCVPAAWGLRSGAGQNQTQPDFQPITTEYLGITFDCWDWRLIVAFMQWACVSEYYCRWLRKTSCHTLRLWCISFYCLVMYCIVQVMYRVSDFSCRNDIILFREPYLQAMLFLGFLHNILPSYFCVFIPYKFDDYHVFYVYILNRICLIWQISSFILMDV